jgi:hypothetical protein
MTATMEEAPATAQEASPLTPPPGTDPQWQEKIQTARDAAEMGRQQRKGQPVSPRHAMLGFR